MKKYVLLFLIFNFSFLIFNCLYADVYSKAKVLSIEKYEIKKEVEIEKVKLLIVSGRHKGSIVEARNYLWDEKHYNTYFKEKDTIVVRISESGMGEIENILIKGYPRDKILFIFILFFLIILFLVCGKKGLKVFLSIAINLFLLTKVLIPLIKNGYPPLTVCSGVAMIAALITLFLILGWTRKFFSSLFGIATGILAAGLLTVFFVNFTKISGIFVEGAQILVTVTRSSASWSISDFKGLVAGGVIIAALGVSIDMVVDIVAGMNSVCQAKPDITRKELFASGICIGRDVLSGMLGSLLMVFTASSLTIIAVYIVLKIPFLRIINWEFFVVVVLQAFISSLAFIVTIPASVASASLILPKNE